MCNLASGHENFHPDVISIAGQLNHDLCVAVNAIKTIYTWKYYPLLFTPYGVPSSSSSSSLETTAVSADTKALAFYKSKGCSHHNWWLIEPLLLPPSMHRSKIGLVMIHDAMVCRLTQVYLTIVYNPSNSNISTDAG